MDVDDIDCGTRIARDLQFSEPVTCREVKRVMKDVDTEETVYYAVHECSDGAGQVLTAEDIKHRFTIVERDDRHIS